MDFAHSMGEGRGVGQLAPRENHQVCALQGSAGFAKPPRRQDGTIGKFLGYVEHDHIDVAGQCQVLETVIENVHIHIEAFFRCTPGVITTSGYDDGNLRKPASEPRWLIADFPRVRRAFARRVDGNQIGTSSAAIPAGQNVRFPSAFEKPLGNPGHQRGLACASHR
jgi:hypothetical protein